MDPDQSPAFCKILLSRDTVMNKMHACSSFEEEIGPLKRAKKMEPIIVVSDTEEESVDMSSSDADSKHEDDPPYSPRATYYKNPKREKVSSDRKDKEAHSGSEEYGLKRNSWIQKQQSKSVYDQNKTVWDKESSIAYQKAKSFKSKNPFIFIALKFARKYFLENDVNLVLRVSGSGSWSVKCTIGTVNAKVGSGWKAFALENKLKVGDVCVFEVLKGKLFVDVIISD
ncbi:B3 domain-containing protein REM19-like [Solanum verrucosum]|uniref:B3 domain-containing protein REM19-like n=1 Tax=Solanum verrucosum TaxID=315347 RepID=UPI0020D1A8E7|nr:B3 domain-containing protein REM19-like [Solanum verrucosum]